MGKVDGVPAQGHQLDWAQAMPVGDQHHGGVAMVVAIGAGGFDEAIDFGVGQVFTRPHLGIAYPLGRSAVRLDCPSMIFVPIRSARAMASRAPPGWPGG